MACLQYWSKIAYLWGYVVVGSLSCVLAQSHMTQKGDVLNFSQQQRRADRRSRPALHTARGFTTLQKESNCRSHALLFCFGGGGAFPRENEVGREFVFSTECPLYYDSSCLQTKSWRFASELGPRPVHIRVRMPFKDGIGWSRTDRKIVW